MRIEVLDATGRSGADTPGWLAARAQAAAGALGAGGSMRVRIVDDAEMAAAHEEFLGVSGTTDVLTFDLSDPAEAEKRAPKPDVADIRSDSDRNLFDVDTDILVCLDEAGRQADRLGYPVRKELLLYVVHGLLHCLGWDDHDEAEASRMHQVEDAVLEAIGVGAAYRGG